MKPELLPWLILFLPLASAAVITLFTRKAKGLSAAISVGAIGVAFLLSVVLFAQTGGGSFISPLLNSEWIHLEDFGVDPTSAVINFGFTIDPLSQLMLLIVTGVGTAIHVFSWGYMHDDRAVSRYFASLSLFCFSMLGIVLANNLVMMFIFWELVGVSSYLLIGYWYEKPSAADACKKAFITNRLGDFGFILGILMVWGILGSFGFGQLQEKIAANPAALGAAATCAGLLIFCGAMGKSAQFPLHVWLPDAMEGPTPVSALIHAATMVAAGVYMLCRVFFLFTPDALCVIAWIGAFTSILAALIAVQQDDIKRILAYSTLSQLGYMVMAVGASKPDAAMFHLTTHAFFKAMLFLGAGSVIHACHHQQDIWEMGGLKKKMPVTFWTFLIGTFALCGVPPFSGFYSKDGILSAANHASPFLFAVSVIVAALTAFYMARLFIIAFLGEARSEHAKHAHESPGIMKWPLVVLAVPSAIAGFFGLNYFLADFFRTEKHGHFQFLNEILGPIGHDPLAAFLGIFATIIGFSVAWFFYAGADRDVLIGKLGILSRAMAGRFYFDEIYAFFIKITHEAVSFLSNFIDRWIVAGLFVRGTHGTVELTGRALRLFQTGNIQTYALLFVAGVVLVLLIALK
jgi:NADH-quinone oxidoreductase subunit L